MFSRRNWMKLLAAGAPGIPVWAQSSYSFPGKRPMLVQNDFPEDLETPPEYFDSWITPNDAFFVRQHLPRPKVDVAAYQLNVNGMVGTPLKLSLDDLKKMPQVKVAATLECAGNGRSYYRPKLPGLQWSKGAIGNAEWRGVRVADLLKKAGASAQAKYGNMNGMDVGAGKTPDFIRSIPMRKLMHESTIVALEMNGEPLPELHGSPARLIVPGWDGASWVKWIDEIKVSEESDKGFFFARGYRYPKYNVGPGGAAKPEDMEVIEGMGVKSFFAKPGDQAKVKLGKIILQGVAWAGENRVMRVEVSTDGGAKWQDAKLSSQNLAFAWRLFTFEWTPPKVGHYVVCSRATDSAGRVQPIDPAWNPSGYLWNGIERMGLMVEA